MIFIDAVLDQAVEVIVTATTRATSAAQARGYQESIAEATIEEAEAAADDAPRATRSTRTPTSARSTRSCSWTRSPSSSRPGKEEGAEIYQPPCRFPEKGYWFA